METTVVNNHELSRYELLSGDAMLGFAEYRSQTIGDGEVVDFHHTLIQPQHRGHGNAERLVGAALDDVRTAGGKVTASCWFVDQFIVEHGQYESLRA